MSFFNTIFFRKNSGSTVAKRSRLNLIEGSNIAITMADDPTDEEADVTIATVGGTLSSGTPDVLTKWDSFGTNLVDSAGRFVDGSLWVGDILLAPVGAGNIVAENTIECNELFYSYGELSQSTFAADNYAMSTNGSGKFNYYDNKNVVGKGIVPIHDVVMLPLQSADISSTPLANSDISGLYRVSYYLQDSAADITAGAVTLSVSWVDNSGTTRTTTSAAVLLTATSSAQASGIIFIQTDGSGSISFSIAHTGIFGTATYDLHITLEVLFQA